ncbi:(2Fe-2S)-binding protein [Arenibaculum pallidiluteum]|uniref:(2Fe-2S)-binding protein n=1 Tax=Arenibaculum pallidiluteum TaxID=2812559 RepID=UPI001A960F13|nr:(2Fe-2S)-binding protein [Arenibaculum pallidiluteum]
MITLSVNGKPVSVDVPKETPLVYVLRNDLSLSGPRLGCAKGECGACTVHVDGRALRSCSIPLESVAGKKVVTLEGLGTPEKPHPLQKAFIEEQALQCGYCTNGMIMQAAELLSNKPKPSEEEIRAALAANLCRCGSQNRVLKAVKRAATEGV